jgi:hypothetical protein
MTDKQRQRLEEHPEIAWAVLGCLFAAVVIAAVLHWYGVR